MKLLAIDYGKSRIGLAVGSEIPKPLSVLDGSDSGRAVESIKNTCVDYEVEKIVLGMPIRSQGEEGALANDIRNFAESLKIETGLDIVFEEEQFTSTEAQDYIDRNGIKNGKEVLDSIAAAILLEQYLNSQ